MTEERSRSKQGAGEAGCVDVLQCRPWLRGIDIPDDPEIVDTAGRFYIDSMARAEYRRRVEGIRPAMSTDEALEFLRSGKSDGPDSQPQEPRNGRLYGEWAPGGSQAPGSEADAMSHWLDQVYRLGPDSVSWRDIESLIRHHLPKLPDERMASMRQAFFRVIKAGRGPSDDVRYPFPGNAHPPVRTLEPNPDYEVPEDGVFSEPDAVVPELIAPFVPCLKDPF